MISRNEQIERLVKQRESALKQEEQRIETDVKKLISKNTSKFKRLMLKNEPFWSFDTTDTAETKTSFLRKLFIVDE